MCEPKKSLKKKAFYISLLIFILILFFKYLRDFIASSEFSDFKFVVLTFSRILFIALVLYLIQYFNLFNKSFYLNSSFFYFFLSILLIFITVNYSNEVLMDLDDQNKNFEHSFFLLYYLSVGFFEELFVRVLMFGIFYRLFFNGKKFRLILITSAFFALFHVTNLFDSEFVKISVINQILYAFGMGMIFQSLLIRVNNVILISVIHGLFDYRMTLRPEFSEIRSSVDSSFSYESFYQTLIFFVLFNLIVVLPFSYFLTKNSNLKL